MEKGLLKPKSIVDGDFMVTQTQNRNAIFKIHIKDDKSLFIKQLVSFDSQNTYFLQKDATCLWLIKNEKVFENLSQYVPEYYGYDPEKQVLIVEYIPEAKNVEEVYQEKKMLDPKMLDQVSKILSSYHFKLEDKTLTNRSVQFFMKQLPWTFQFAASSGAYSSQFSAMNQTNPVMNYLKDNSAFLSLMKNYVKDYEFTTLIHGDIKWMNFILKNSGDVDSLKIIDWELADIGDPLWDMAGVIQSLFTSKVLLSMTVAPGVYQGASSLTQQQMTQTLEEINVIWSSYCKYQNFDDTKKHDGLLKTLRFAGMRLVQTAFEHNVSSQQLMPNTIKLLQISHSLLQSADILVNQIINLKTPIYESHNA